MMPTVLGGWMAEVHPYDCLGDHGIRVGRGSRLTIATERQRIDRVDRGMVVSEPTGRMVVVIEGEVDLVRELLGKNFDSRAERVMRRLSS